MLKFLHQLPIWVPKIVMNKDYYKTRDKEKYACYQQLNYLYIKDNDELWKQKQAQHKEWGKAYRQSHKEDVKQRRFTYDQIYNFRHKDKILAKKRDHYHTKLSKNPEYLAKRHARYLAKREHYIEYARQRKLKLKSML